MDGRDAPGSPWRLSGSLGYGVQLRWSSTHRCAHSGLGACCLGPTAPGQRIEQGACHAAAWSRGDRGYRSQAEEICLVSPSWSLLRCGDDARSTVFVAHERAQPCLRIPPPGPPVHCSRRKSNWRLNSSAAWVSPQAAPQLTGWCLPAFLPPGALVHRAAYDIKNHTSIIKKSYFHQDLSLIFV